MTLPNFLIIGASKAGTTSFYRYLRQHPDVFMSPVKEPAYYAPARSQIRTLAEYERLFDGVTTQHAVGEASPQYLNDAGAPRRIGADLPGVRLIVSLRNPADHAYSSYLGRLAAGDERRGIEEALRAGTYYFESSLYAEALARYLSHFGRDRMKIVLFDDFVTDPRRVLRDLCAFLEIDSRFAFDTSARYGAAAAPRSLAANAVFVKTINAARRLVPASMRDTGIARRVHERLFLRAPAPLPQDIRRNLLAAFAGDIQKTEALIGRSLSHWLD